jgi:hypothetical protein
MILVATSRISIRKIHIAYNTFSGYGSRTFSAMHSPITNFQLAHLSGRNYNLPSIWHIYIIMWRKVHSNYSTVNVSWVWHIFFVEDFFSFHDVETCYINFKYLFQCYKHLFMKKGSSFILFCLYLWDPQNWVILDRILGLSLRGALAWFHGVWSCGVEVFEYWMISSLKIKLNCSWKFLRNWNVPLVLLERPRWARLMKFIW